MIANPIFAVNENGYAEIDHSMLKCISEEANYLNKLPDTFPVESYKLYADISSILGNCSKGKLEYEKIIVPERNIKLVGHKDMAIVAPLDRYRLLGHVGAIRIIHPEDTDKHMGVAIACTPKGIQIAFGTRISICRNQCIYGGKHLSTWGSTDSKVSYEKMLNMLDYWCQNWLSIRENEYAIIEHMKKTMIDSKRLTMLIGDMYFQSRLDNLRVSNYNMLSVNEVGKVFDSFVTHNNYVDILDSKFEMSLWDFYNACTSILNPTKNADSATYLQSNNNISKYLFDRFELNTFLLN